MCIGFPPPSPQQQRLFVDFHYSTAFGDQIGEVHNSWTRVGLVKHNSSQPTLLAVANSDTSMWITPTTSQCTHRYQEIGDFHCPLQCRAQLIFPNVVSPLWILLHACTITFHTCLIIEGQSPHFVTWSCRSHERWFLVVGYIIIADEVWLTLFTSSSRMSSSSED